MTQDTSARALSLLPSERSNARRDIVVIGTSAGGIDALRTIAAALPPNFPAAVFAVLHTAPSSPGLLASILQRAGPLPTTAVDDTELIQPGRIYVPAPDRHLIVEVGVARATRGPKENRFRPAVDPLFRSAAQSYGARVIGVVLTGGLDDGTAGLAAIKTLGGIAVVQDPEDALFPSMPLSAIRHVNVDRCVSLAQVAPLLVRLTSERVQQKGVDNVSEDIRIEVDIAREDNALEAGVMKLGQPSIYACPECHGVLLQVKESAGGRRFRCHTGHAYSVESLLSEMQEKTEETLWSAIRAMEEQALLLRHLADHLTGGGPASADLRTRADRTTQHIELVRAAVLEQLGSAELDTAI